MKNSNYYLAIMTALVGLIMLIAAKPIVTVLIIVIGIYEIITGVFILTNVVSLVEEKSFKILSIVRGVFSIILGLLCVILPIAMATFAWQVMVYIIAIYTIVSAILEVIMIFKMREFAVETKRYIIETISSVILAIILFMLPSDFGFTIIRIGGALLIIAAAVFAFNCYKNRDIVASDVEVHDDVDGTQDDSESTT